MISVVDLGVLGYVEASELQSETLEKVRLGETPETIFLVEHPPILTLGANFHAENMPLPPEAYAAKGIEIYPTDRGGDITYHGPGQLVAYPIISLENRGKDLHAYLRQLEEAVMRTLGSFGIESRRFPPHTGVWVGEEKICAMGIRVRKWTTMHGLALNCNVDLEPFQWFVPCGIRGYGVASMSSVLGREVAVAEVRPRLVEQLLETLGP